MSKSNNDNFLEETNELISLFKSGDYTIQTAYVGTAFGNFTLLNSVLTSIGKWLIYLAFRVTTLPAAHERERRIILVRPARQESLIAFTRTAC